MSELYNLPNIRELLTNGFNDAELRALCFDLPGFRSVYDQLAQNTSKAEIVAKLLEHTEKTLQLDLSEIDLRVVDLSGADLRAARQGGSKDSILPRPEQFVRTKHFRW